MSIRRFCAALSAATFSLCLSRSAPVGAQTFSVGGFAYENLHSGNGMISIEFDPAGRMLVCEKRGRVLLFQPNGSGGFLAPTVFGSFTVSWDAESGLLGMALDPSYASNRYVYFLYTTTTDQRVVRVTATASFDAIVPGSELVLLSGLPRNVPFHKAGDLKFAPGDDQSLYVSLGDDGRPARAQDLAYYEGKLLRVDKTNGLGLSTNPFHEGVLDSIRSRIWARGFRNPFRLAFHPQRPVVDALYDSENGNSTDRIAWVKMGSNGNWGPGGDPAFLAPTDPDFRLLHSAAPIALGVDIVRGGAFADPQHAGSDILYWAHMSGGASEIRRWRLTGASLDQLAPILADQGNAFVQNLPGGAARGAHLRFGPDGALYFSDTNSFESAGGFYRLARIRFVGGVAPSAGFTTNPTPPEGDAPLAVSFDDDSSDADGTIVSRQWAFGDGASSTATNPAHSYQQPGSYTATLVVTDNHGLTDRGSVTVTVTQTANLTLAGQLRDGRTLAGSPLATATQLRLYQADGTTPLPFAGGSGPNGNGVLVPAGGVIAASLSAELSGGGVVVSAGEGAATFRPVFTGFNVPASPHTQELRLYLSDTALRGRVRDTRGAPAQIDLGIAQGGPHPIASGRDFLAASMLASSGVAHRIVSDELGFFYFPLVTGSAGGFEVDAVADTGGALYYATGFTRSVGSGTLETHDLVVGLKSGGRDCSEPAPSSDLVDYDTQVQPIWDNYCTGCHNEVPGQNGGLNLVAGSRSALVDLASTEVPGMRLVAPGSARDSYLFEKIACQNPQVLDPMRPDGLLQPAQQALVFNWIEQGAQPSAPTNVGGTGNGGAGGDDGEMTGGVGGVPAGDAGAPGRPTGGGEGTSNDAGAPGDRGGFAGSSNAGQSTAGDDHDDDSGACSCRHVRSRRADLGWLAVGALVLAARRRALKGRADRSAHPSSRRRR